MSSDKFSLAGCPRCEKNPSRALSFFRRSHLLISPVFSIVDLLRYLRAGRLHALPTNPLRPRALSCVSAAPHAALIRLLYSRSPLTDSFWQVTRAAKQIRRARCASYPRCQTIRRARRAGICSAASPAALTPLLHNSSSLTTSF